MPHSHRVGIRKRPSFVGGVSTALGSVVLLIFVFAAAPTLAAEKAAIAFVLGPNSHLTLGGDEVLLPEGARIELLVSDEETNGRVPVQVRPGGLVIPEIPLGEDGSSLRVRLGQGSTGWLAPDPFGVAAELMATLQVEVVGESGVRVGEYAIALTTESPVESAQALRGSAIDYASGSARLVAKSTLVPDSPVAPGEAIVVVLEGAFEGLPASLR
jgi:hypothetical protein